MLCRRSLEEARRLFITVCVRAEIGVLLSRRRTPGPEVFARLQPPQVGEDEAGVQPAAAAGHLLRPRARASPAPDKGFGVAGVRGLARVVYELGHLTRNLLNGVHGPRFVSQQ